MEILTNLKIRTKLMCLTIVMGIFIAAMSASGIKLANDVNEQYQVTVDQDAYAATLATQTGKYFSEMRNELTRYLARVDPAARQQSLSSMQSFDGKLDTVLEELQKRAVTADGKKAMAELNNNLRTYRTQREALIKAQTVPGTPMENTAEAKAVHVSGDALSKEFDSIAELSAAGVKTRVQEVDQEIDSAIMTAIVIAIVVLALAFACGWFLSRNIGNRMEKLAAAAERIAKGDLSQPLASDSTDEIGQAVANFEKMRQALNQTMNNIHVAADQVAAGSQNVSEASMSLSQGAAEQASSVEELSASISEISSQTASNAENAEKANTLTIHAHEQAKLGDADMKKMLEAMEDINTSSANISKIIKVIDEIAFQTNILALNAAVEAARAGQHGKGFAVVAEEVRNLAARSAKAAKETTELIENSIEKVEAGRAIAGKTAESLMTIMGNVNEVADIVGAIAKASSEQKLALEQIDQGVLQVSQVVQANSATSEQAASASEELNAQAVTLNETANSFRLEQNASTFRAGGYTAMPRAKRVAPAPMPESQFAPKASAVRANVSSNEEEDFGKY